jgi:hypothetical protein
LGEKNLSGRVAHRARPAGITAAMYVDYPENDISSMNLQPGRTQKQVAMGVPT